MAVSFPRVISSFQLKTSIAPFELSMSETSNLRETSPTKYSSFSQRINTESIQKEHSRKSVVIDSVLVLKSKKKSTVKTDGFSDQRHLRQCSLFGAKLETLNRAKTTGPKKVKFLEDHFLEVIDIPSFKEYNKLPYVNGKDDSMSDKVMQKCTCVII